MAAEKERRYGNRLIEIPGHSEGKDTFVLQKYPKVPRRKLNQAYKAAKKLDSNLERDEKSSQFG